MRAAEVRLEVEKVSHPRAKKTLLSMAKTYDQLAQQAESLAESKEPNTRR
jgi:aromatic ring hydroxylase